MMAYETWQSKESMYWTSDHESSANRHQASIETKWIIRNALMEHISDHWRHSLSLPQYRVASSGSELVGIDYDRSTEGADLQCTQLTIDPANSNRFKMKKKQTQSDNSNVALWIVTSLSVWGDNASYWRQMMSKSKTRQRCTVCAQHRTDTEIGKMNQNVMNKQHHRQDIRLSRPINYQRKWHKTKESNCNVEAKPIIQFKFEPTNGRLKKQMTICTSILCHAMQSICRVVIGLKCVPIQVDNDSLQQSKQTEINANECNTTEARHRASCVWLCCKVTIVTAPWRIAINQPRKSHIDPMNLMVETNGNVKLKRHKPKMG